MKLREIVNSKQTLEYILTQKMKPSIAFGLSQLSKKLSEELKTFEESRLKCIKEYGEEKVRIEDGEEVKYSQVSPENISIFKEEIEELLDVELSIEFKKVNISDLEDLKISPADAMSVEWLIEE